MKIISSIGPTSKNPEIIDKLIDEGCSSFRFNSSRILKQEFDELICHLKSRPGIEIIFDLRGHKIRISKLLSDVYLSDGEEIILCSEKYFEKNKNKTREKLIPINIEFDIWRLRGCKFAYIKDKSIKLLINEYKTYKEECIFCLVEGEGSIYRNTGINFPEFNRCDLRLPEKDKDDIAFAIKCGVDVIYLSYVTNEKMVIEAKDLINDICKINVGCKKPKVYSKIESIRGFNNFENIMKASDGIVIGRGDIYSEIHPYEFPALQQNVINRMKKIKKELIIATNIINTMRFNVDPSHAETSDLYRFINDKVDGVMLVNETCVARKPWLFVKFINEFINYNQKGRLK